MIPILILLTLVSMAQIILVNIVKKLFKVPSNLKPLLPLISGIAIGLIFFFVPRLAFTLREAVLFGISSGGLSVIFYDMVKK